MLPAISALDMTRFCGVTSDSRKVEAGYVFAAIPGVTQNGERFIPDAIQKGALGILCRKDWQGQLPAQVQRIAVENPRLGLSQLAAAYYAPMPRHIMVITGTDGKTSTAEFCRQLLEGGGHKAATLGTLGLNCTHYTAAQAFPNTTPDPVILHQHLQSLALAGVQHVAMEASSHGLHQYRLDGIVPEAVAFTTLGSDHADYHPTPEDYFNAKARLFRELAPSGATAVLNADDAHIMTLASECAAKGLKIYGFGKKGKEFTVRKAIPMAQGIAATINVMGSEWSGVVPLYGTFQLMNVLAAAACVWPHLGHAERFFSLLPAMMGVRGRLEKVAELPQGQPIFVDYAHTAQALEKILHSLRPHTAGKLMVVFGCGGDRDRTKRPEMGKVAAQLADAVVITDDNPRSEAPSVIRAEILAACPGAAEIGDREEAIRYALCHLNAGDVLVVAGKGHETTQIIGSKTLEFNDAEVIRSCIMEIV